MKGAIIALLAGSAGLIAVSLVAQAQTSPPQPYRPGLGDLMTMTVQPRHIKIALAGRERNWPFVKYELHELQEALDRVVQNWPRWKGLPLGGMVDAISQGPMAEVSQAIEENSAEKFAAAYAQLTEGCNACHQAANVGLVVIKVPDASSFPDQDFRPLKP